MRVKGVEVRCPHCTGELHAFHTEREFAGEQSKNSEISECGSLAWFTTITIECWHCGKEICKVGAIGEASLSKDGWRSSQPVFQK